VHKFGLGWMLWNDLSHGKWTSDLDRETSGVYRSGSLKTVSGELAKYKLDLVGVLNVRCEKDGTETAGDYSLLYRNGNADHHLGIGFFMEQL
jgi:hypothetical protein